MSSAVASPLFAALDRDHPFPGLRAYEEADAAWFFGRGREINELLKRLRRVRFLAVVGPSGCGKSSLIKAGVLPAVRDCYLDTKWQIATLRPDERPLDNLAAAISFESGSTPSEIRKVLDRGPMSLAEAIAPRAFSAGTNVLILVDQFEELFQYVQRVGDSAQEEAKAFLKLLLTAAASGTAPVYIVITMRLEWLNECATYGGLAEAINEGIYLVPQPSRRQFQQTILGPIEAAGGSLTAALLDRLLNDLDGRTDQLPVLQHALMRMWELRTGASLDIDTYQDVGTFSDCLSNHAEEVFSNFSGSRSEEVAELLFRSITQVYKGRKMRRPRPLGEIAKITGAAIDELQTVVEAFRQEGRSFIVTTPGDLRPESIIDISHEALIRQWSRLCKWVENEAEIQAKIDRLESVAAEWDAGKRQDKSALYRGSFLKQTEELRSRIEPDSPAAGFLKASRSAEFWRRIWLRGSIALFALLVVAWLATWAVQQRAAAHQAAENEQKIKHLVDQQNIRDQQYQTFVNNLLASSKPTDATYASVVRTIQGKRIYLQYVGSEQLNVAKELQAYLIAQSYAVPGVQKVAPTMAPHQLQVRYFHKEDELDAGKIRDLLTNVLAGSASPVRTSDPQNVVPIGQFEIWLPPGSILLAAASTPNFAGTWIQTDPEANPKMRMKIVQNGNQLSVWLSYSDVFGSQPFGQAPVDKDKAVWTRPQACATQFQKPGYDYSQPGTNTFTLELKETALLYTQETIWTSPCDGHPIGTETVTKNLQRSE